MERTHLALNDLDWLPFSIKTARVAATVTCTVAGVAGAFLVSTHAPDLAVMVMGGGGVVLASQTSPRLVESLLRRQGTPTTLAELHTREDGERVRVRGRVRAREPLRAFLDGSSCVFRRVRFVFQAPLIHEAAIDFALTDAAGTQIGIETADARLLAPQPKTRKYDDEFQERFLSLPLPSRMQAKARRGLAMVADRRSHHLLPIHAGEVLVRDGDEIDVIGYKSRVIDPTVADRMARETPMRITLRGGKLPLLLFPAT